MADKIELEIVIDAEGNVRIKTEGMKGEECLVETKALEAAVGEVSSRTKTSAFYQKSARQKTRTSQR
jgi:hypothetical protein